jgi:ABC-type transporter Mla subunit MlaD
MTRSRAISLAGLLAAVVLVVVLIGGGGTSDRTFYATVPAADDLLNGQEINAGGQKVGHVSEVVPIDRGRAARIKMEISDADYWPLPRDSKLEIRFGGTVSFSNRYLLLTRGKAAQDLANGDSLAPGAVKTPVEVDQFFDQFPEPVRKSYQKLIGNSAPVLKEGGPDLNRALAPDKLPLVTTGAGKLTQDLTKDDASLRMLVRSTGRVLKAADTSSPDFGTLLTGFAQTATAIANQSTNLKTTLTQFPAALRQTRTTLGKAEVTLGDVQGLTDELGPGVTQLRAITRPLTKTLQTVRDVAPIGSRALRLAGGVKGATRLLNQLTGRVPMLRRIFTQLDTEVGCLRPYTPDIVQFGQVWGDFTDLADTRDRTVRAYVGNFLPAGINNIPYTAGDAKKTFPGLRYAFPHPPGDLAAQPWFQPQCGITEKALDPNQDPESANFKASQEKNK